MWWNSNNNKHKIPTSQIYRLFFSIFFVSVHCVLIHLTIFIHSMQWLISINVASHLLCKKTATAFRSKWNCCVCHEWREENDLKARLQSRPNHIEIEKNILFVPPLRHLLKAHFSIHLFNVKKKCEWWMICTNHKSLKLLCEVSELYASKFTTIWNLLRFKDYSRPRNSICRARYKSDSSFLSLSVELNFSLLEWIYEYFFYYFSCAFDRFIYFVMICRLTSSSYECQTLATKHFKMDFHIVKFYAY